MADQGTELVADDLPTTPHATDAEDVLSVLGVDPDTGLSDDEVERRRRRYGDNELSGTEPTSLLSLIVNQFREPVVLLLVVAAGVGAAIGETVEAIAVLIVLAANAIVGVLTELRATRSMEALQGMLRTVAEVERGDRRDEIDAAGLVPGDVVGIEAGERVPADLRIFEADELAIEESSLTGESDPVDKDIDPVGADAPLAERTSMAFLGTTVTSGRGRAVVVATGSATEVGDIAELAGGVEDRKAPLQEGLDQLGKRLTLVVIAGALVLVGLGLLRGQDLTEVVEIAIALAIAVVPEGLPAVATLTLAVGMRRMSEEGALVQRLAAVETLGSTTVIASDKTGTLTTNKMTVVEVVLADGADEDELWRAAVLCNDADVDPDGDPVGDPTEVALLHAANEHGLAWRALREDGERQTAHPFDSDRKRMVTVDDGQIHVKGAPEALIDAQRHPQLSEAAERFAGQALRTLAFAAGPLPTGVDPDDEQALLDAVDLLGVVGMKDPPREAAIEAVDSVHAAGVRVVMITGDRPDTGAAIASELGLREEQVLTGAELAEGDGSMTARAKDTDVFARVDPGQKLTIVEALQDQGEVVAVTGDGVNDAPALRQADIGVAMGTGTDVAREAADIVLTDDDFSTIVEAVGEGRRIFGNIRRFGQFLFSWHVAEVLTVAIVTLIGLPAPLTGLAILWNNLVIDVLPSFALALEPSRDEAMREPPRPPGAPVIDRAVFTRILVAGLQVAAVGLVTYFWLRGPLGFEEAEVRTGVFVALSSAQLLSVFNARTDRGHGFRGVGQNRWLWAALAVVLALEAIALSVPPLRELLELSTMPGVGWAIALGLAPLPLLATQTVRIIRDRR